jgi:hypothetical protein
MPIKGIKTNVMVVGVLTRANQIHAENVVLQIASTSQKQNQSFVTNAKNTPADD